MNALDMTFQRLRKEGRKAFIPFLTAGDPDLETTSRLVAEAARRGASVIEIGFPYSDPIADGSVIQASYTRVLDRGLKVEAIFAWLAGLKVDVPLVAMVSYSLVHARGAERFVAQAQEAGLVGAIVPDLPVDEAEPLAEVCRAADFKLILLVTPTTPRERAEEIVRCSSGFVYCVSVVGITGERTTIPPQLTEQLDWLRTRTDLPLCVGFGISRPEHVHLLRDHADGVIVGSALVKKIEAGGPNVVAAVGDLVEELAQAL